MSRWTAITIDHLKSASRGELIEAAETEAAGDLSPIAETIADCVARVRRAVSAGNVLDVDPAKVPASLKGLTVRLVIYGLHERIGEGLGEDLRDQRRADFADLNRLTDNRIKVEAPDTPAASGEMQATGRQVEAVNVSPRLCGRERTAGL